MSETDRAPDTGIVGVRAKRQRTPTAIALFVGSILAMLAVSTIGVRLVASSFLPSIVVDFLPFVLGAASVAFWVLDGVTIEVGASQLRVGRSCVPLEAVDVTVDQYRYESLHRYVRGWYWLPILSVSDGDDTVLEVLRLGGGGQCEPAQRASLPRYGLKPDQWDVLVSALEDSAERCRRRK